MFGYIGTGATREGLQWLSRRSGVTSVGGLVWVSNGRVYIGNGPFDERWLELCSGSPLVIGSSAQQSVGEFSGGAFVHYGVPKSEDIQRVFERARGEFAWGLRRLRGALALLAVVNGRAPYLVLCRRDNPLYWAGKDDGIYISSKVFAGCVLVPNGHFVQLGVSGVRLLVSRV